MTPEKYIAHGAEWIALRTQIINQALIALEEKMEEEPDIYEFDDEDYDNVVRDLIDAGFQEESNWSFFSEDSRPVRMSD